MYATNQGNEPAFTIKPLMWLAILAPGAAVWTGVIWLAIKAVSRVW